MTVTRSAAISVIVLAAACVALSLTACEHAAGNTLVSAPATVAPVVSVTRDNLSTDLVLTAEFTPYQDVDVMAKVAGYVRKISVDIGDHVRRGELLATLEVPELQDETAKATAAVAAAKADVLTAEGSVKRAQAAASIAHLSYQRIEDVSAKHPGLVPLQEVDVAKSRDLEAAAQLAGAQSSLQAAHETQTVATSERMRAQAMQSYAEIRAPFVGVVTKRYANTGSMIQAGTASQTQAMPIVRLAQNDLLRLIFPVPVNEAAQIRVGQPVTVNVTTLGRTFPGKITRYADTLQMSTRTMDTEVDVPNLKGILIPGMYAEVRLNASSGPVLSVPLDGVEGLGGSTQTAYVVRDGKVAIVPVTTGVQTPTRVAILTGLKEGDVVIVGRHTIFSDGQHVLSEPAEYENQTTPHS